MPHHIFILFSYFAALPVQAAGLVLCGGNGEHECGLSDLIGMANGIEAYLLYIGVFVGVLMISYAGFTLVISQGNESAMEQAKSRVWNVAVGFVIILLSFLIVNTVLTVLTGNGFERWGINTSSTSKTPTIGR